MSTLVLVRHGQTTWSATGRHTSHTDLGLTLDGEREAVALAPRLVAAAPVAVVCSPRRRARVTAELAGLTVTTVDEDLAEWDYGDYEGLTTAEIRESDPDWTLWTDGAPGGESPAQVTVRIDRVLARLATMEGTVAVVGHGHCLRCLTARWLGLTVADGALFQLDSGSVSVLGHEHGRATIDQWNLR